MSYFANIYKQSRLFLVFAVIATIWGLLSPIIMALILLEPQRIIIMDDAANYHLVTTYAMPDAKKLHEECIKNAVNTLFLRNPAGLLDPYGMQRIYMKPTHETINKYLKDTELEFTTKNIHQLVEIEKIKAIPQQNGSYVAHIKAILTRSCEYEKTPFIEVKELRLSLLLYVTAR